MPFQLTDEQNAVANHDASKHGRVLAGPGTGKSATAVELAERLLNQEALPRLKFLTFTRAATIELDKKLAVQGKVKPATIHSFAISTLLNNRGCAPMPHPLRIPDDYEYKALIRPHLARRASVGVRRFDDLVKEMAAKWESLDPTELSEITPAERARFTGAYAEHRRAFGNTLLAELPDLLRCALRDHADLDGIGYDLLIVDEYQDLNACDLEVLKRLANRGMSILAVGDDDQSIYSFRKAHPAGIRRFLIDYPNAHNYLINICQRLPKKIAQWAYEIIAADPDRHKPQIQCREGAPEGMIGLLNFGSEVTEARGLADLISWLKDAKNISLSEILILSRTDYRGTFTRSLKEELVRRGLPMFDPAEIEVVLSDPPNRQLLAALRLIVDRQDSLAWLTLLRLEGGIGDTFIDHIYQRAVSGGITFAQALADESTEGFEEVSSVALRKRAHRLYERVITLLETVSIPVATPETKWGDWIVAEVEAGRLSPATEAFKAMLKSLDESYKEAEEGLGRFLSQLQPLSEDLARAQSQGVRFMTMVSSKGLTVRATIVVGVDNDLIPRPGMDINEERRLLYVAMTRSTDYLFLTWTKRRQGPAARAGNANPGRRTYSELLKSGSVESEDGTAFIQRLAKSPVPTND
jgi:DNA helicase-2/ATP-dependent DNA helicase PcrA